MKVVHFAEILRGGIATYINELTSWQVGSYDSVTVFGPDDQLDLLAVPGVTVVGFPNRGRGLLALWDLWVAWRRLLAANSFDIHHLHSTFAGLVGRISPAAGQVVYCPHGWSFSRRTTIPLKAAYRLVEGALSFRSSATVCISKAELELAGSIGLHKSRCFLIYSGIADRAVRGRNAERGTREHLVAAYVGRYDRQKGLDLLLEAMDRIPPSQLQVMAIGEAVVDGYKDLQFPKGVTNRGWLSHDHVLEVLDTVDFVVMPSRWEGFSLVALEALRAGCPIVASNIPSLSEVVRDGWNGVLFEPESASSLHDGLVRAIQMDLTGMRQNSRSLFVDNYSAKRMFEEHDRLYQSLASGGA